MERRLIFGTATALALLFAGCMGGAPTGTAQGLVDDARDAAGERVDDPTLVRVTGLEPFRHEVEEHGEEREEFWLHLDDDNADGQAPGWLYTFRDGTTLYRVAVYASGEVLGEALEADPDEREPDEPGTPLQGWEVDTDEVAETLADHPDWPAPRENDTVRWSLSMREGEPVWRVSNDDGLVIISSDERRAFVHAGNGTVLAVEERERGFRAPEEEPRRESDVEESSGTVSPSDDVEASIEVEGPGRVEAVLEAEASELGEGGGSVTFELLRDEEVERSTTLEESGSATRKLTVENARPGEWTARASTSDDVRDVTVVVRGNWTE